MDSLFLTVLNMSLIGAFVIAAISIARIPLRKAPKIISYVLWTVAGFRLVVPFTFESIISLIPFNAQTIPMDIAVQMTPRINSGVSSVNNIVNNMLPSGMSHYSANPLQIWIAIGTFIWLFGAAVMLVYGVVSFIVLKRKMRGAAYIEANIYEAENIKSPFVLGIFFPKIYMPVGLSEHEREYILLHEQTHIRRRDHIVKFAAYFILCFHWFNPLVWLAFLLMSADMEMSCDERVLNELGEDLSDEYSMSLVRIATGRRVFNGSPLAFGEGGIKERVKRVLTFKKPSRIIVILSIALVVVMSTGFAVNRITSENDYLFEMFIVYEENPAIFFPDMKLVWDDTAYHVVHMDNPRKGRQIGFAVDEFSTWSIHEVIGYGTNILLAVESEDVWRVMNHDPPIAPVGQFILENATDEDKLLRTLSLTLYDDGRVYIAESPVSSFAFFDSYYYMFTNGELLIYLEDGSVIIRFDVDYDGALIFRSATVPLRAIPGARYVAGVEG